MKDDRTHEIRLIPQKKQIPSFVSFAVHLLLRLPSFVAASEALPLDCQCRRELALPAKWNMSAIAQDSPHVGLAITRCKTHSVAVPAGFLYAYDHKKIHLVSAQELLGHRSIVEWVGSLARCFRADSRH